MDRRFTLADARGLMPEVQRRAATYVDLRADYADARTAGTAKGALAELKGLEARLHEQLEWFHNEGIQVKGMAPLLIDFPSSLQGRDVLLCWLEGEPELAWYHPAETGFMGRRRFDHPL